MDSETISLVKQVFDFLAAVYRYLWSHPIVALILLVVFVAMALLYPTLRAVFYDYRRMAIGVDMDELEGEHDLYQ